MAKYYSSTFGKISGKHGNAVAVIRKDGSTYLRLHVPASNPRTEKQQAHRAKFALTSKALVPFNPIFKETMGITNGISTARSYAFKNAIVGEYPNFEMDYSKLMFSFGQIEKLHDASVSISERVMAIKWSFKNMHNCHKNDSVSLIVFNKDSNQTIHLKDVATRNDKEAKIEIDDTWANCELYLWAYVTRGDKSSNSVFVEKDTFVTDNESIQGVSDEASHKSEPIRNISNKVIMNLIVMLCNLIHLFKQAVVDINRHNPDTILIHNTLNASEKNARTFKLKLENTLIGVSEKLYSKYKNIFKFKPIPIPDIRHVMANMVLTDIGKGQLRAII